MNWFNNCGGFNNNFGYRANTATAPSNNFYTNSASNTTTPGSTTIGLGPGSIGLGPGGYGPGNIGTGTGTTGTGSNNGSTGSPTWGNGTGRGDRSYDNFLIYGFNPGHEQCGVLNTRWKRRFGEAAINSIDGRGGFWGGNSGSWGSNNGNTGWGNRSYDNFLIDGFNPGHEQYGVLDTRWKRRFSEAAINSIDGRGGFCGNFAYPRSLYGLC